MPNRARALEAAMYADGYIPPEHLAMIDRQARFAKRMRELQNEDMRQRRQEDPEDFTEISKGRAIMRAEGPDRTSADADDEALARLIDMVANQGRYGDSELAHINPREAALLRAMGGAGTINPRTGLREFYAGADPGDPTGMGMDAGVGNTTDSPAAGQDDGGARDVDLGEVQGPPAPSFMDRLSDELNPETQQGFTNIATAFGPMGLASRGARGLAEALGEYVGGPLNEAFGGTAPSISFDYSLGPEGRNPDLMAAMTQATPIAEPLMTPAALGGVPEEIQSFIGPGMSDLQQRALISTYGTQGVNSAFRTDPVRRYYARLLQRGLLEDGRPAATPYTLPIEQLYMQNVMGRPVANVGDTRSILNAIGGYL